MLISPPKHILALDLGTECGWHHTANVGGTWNLSIKKDESDGVRLIKFAAKIRTIHKKYGIDLVAYEAIRFAGKNSHRANNVLSEYVGALKLLSFECNFNYKGYSSTEIKKFATGKGNASKKDMLDAARERWPFVVDHNHADALWTLKLACNEFLWVREGG